jgi:DNA-binding transcriptional MerR regulator
MRIGILAAKTAVSVQTIRYYERRGLLKKPSRLSSGYRDYATGMVAVVDFIRRSQESGFTLSEIETLLRLLSSRSLSAVEARARVTDKVRQIDSRIQSLQMIRNKLTEGLKTCECRDGRTLCPNLRSLAENMKSI